MPHDAFPGVVIDPANNLCVDEVPIQIVPTRTCECMAECTDPLAPPTNVMNVGRKLDPNTLPLIAMPRNRTHKIAYWGQNEATVRAADVVLVPAKFRNDPVVGEFGNFGFDVDGVPIIGANENLARDVFARYGEIGFKSAPGAGCRNIWCDLVYLDEVLCLGVDPQKRKYQFYDAECMCYSEAASIDVSDLVSHENLHRILPDDGFNGMPLGYPEALRFEYCALPQMVNEECVENTFFKFCRKTPDCARPSQGYLVRVEITSKVCPLTVEWADLLPPGHTLLSGATSGTAVFTGDGETQVFEYVVKTPAVGSPSTITGTAQKVLEPLTQLALLSDPVTLDAACSSLQFLAFGSQTPTGYGRVFWAGGGRPDPVIPAGINLWVRMYAGQGSAGISPREVYLSAPTIVPAAALTHTFTVAPGGTIGFAVDLPVWIFNQCFPDNPVRRIHCLDIDAEESASGANEGVTGLYGKVTAIDPSLNLITVEFHRPPSQDVQFSPLAKSEIMVSPDLAEGFYWEASSALVELTGVDDPSHTLDRKSVV